jgi:L-seryl-tRNA(Ser) seleniumtransferase
MVAAAREGEDPKHEAPKNQLEIVSMTLQSGEDLILARRLREILNGARVKARVA